MQEIQNDDPMKPGAQFMEYTIAEILGSGNFGVVYKATNRYLDETVAIKEFFPRQLAHRTEDFQIAPISSETDRAFHWALNRFLKEARILWDLSSPTPYPGIIQVKSYREANGTAYMIMEYAEGQPLSELIRDHRALSPEQLARIVDPLLDGLEKVHNASTLHRDIKPSNILIRPDGAPVLIDFGAAKPDFDQMDSKSTMVVYTPMYAPPEQLVAEGRLGAWTDIYSLGATLYHTVTGHPPVNPVSRIQGLRQSSATEAANGRFPENLLKGIDAAIEPIYSDRPQTISALRKLIHPSGYHPDLDCTVISGGSRSSRMKPGSELVFPTVVLPNLGENPEQRRISARRKWLLGLFATSIAVAVLAIPVYLNRIAAPSQPVEATTKQPAVQPTESVSDLVNRRLEKFDCTLLDTHFTDDSLAISGYIANSETLRQLLTDFEGLSQIKTFKADIEPGLDPFCEVIRFYKEYLIIDSGKNRTITLAFNHPDRAYASHDILFINAISNDPSQGYLYVDFFDREGNVVHMLPSAFKTDNALAFHDEIFIGEKRKASNFENKRSYEILPPFGIHLVTTLFSKSRLYEEPRPEVESIGKYLEALKPILSKLPDDRRPDASIDVLKTAEGG